MPKAFARPSKDAQDAALAKAQSIAAGLFPHQVEGVAFLLGRRKAILADDMGLGKTRQSIVALRSAEPDGPYLVVCPASVKQNWAREIHAVEPDAAVHVVDGKTPPADTRWTVINYDILNKHITALEAVPWKGIVFDEAHFLRNRDSQRSKVARRLAQTADKHTGPLVYALTGTPITNRPRDLFPLLQLLSHSLGRSFLSFAKRYCAAYQTPYGWVTDGASNLEELTLELHGALLRRTKDEVLDLPPKLRAWTPVTIDRNAGAKEMFQVLQLLLGGNGGVRSGDSVRLLSHLSTARLKIAAAKTAHTIALLENAIDQDEKVIVFSCFDQPLQDIKNHFGDAAVLVTGATPGARRQKLVDSFQNDAKVKVFVANIIAGGVGLNLTAASQVFFNDLDWVPANHWQAEDRAYRIGQQRTVNVTYVTAEDTIDEFVSTVLAAKSKLIEVVVDGKGGDAGSTDVLGELERILGAISPQIPEKLTESDIQALLREAAGRVRADDGTVSGGQQGGVPTEALEKALEALARVLRGPTVEKHRIESSSRPGTFYEITVDGGDVMCSCPGFEYRGTCSHTRTFRKR
jgi:SNF2 family DNA or RNA helicase